MSRAIHSLPALATLSVLALFTIPAAHAQSDDAAHAIAEKFATADREAKRAAETRKAQAEAAQRAAAAQAADRSRTEEAEMLERARLEAAEREAEARRAEDERRLAEARKREDERLAREKEEQRLADERRQLEERRQAEALALSEKLRRARELRQATQAEPSPAPAEWETPSRPKFFSGAPQDQKAGEADWASEPPLERVPVPREDTHRALWPEQTVTVLLVMEPGDRGIRRFDKSADPVLCVGTKCFASLGSDKAAKNMSRAMALGPANTLGARAWGCRHSLTCVFRAVDLGAESAVIQPIDLKVLRHDRRESRSVKADLSCEISPGGQLHCANPVQTRTWRAWIIPETVAKMAGAGALEAALRAGLPDYRSAGLR